MDCRRVLHAGRHWTGLPAVPFVRARIGGSFLDLGEKAGFRKVLSPNSIIKQLPKYATHEDDPSENDLAEHTLNV